MQNRRLVAEGDLILTEATPRDTGIYTCRVSNFYGSKSASTDVIVGQAPRFENDVDLNIEFEDGTFAELNCQSYSESGATVSESIYSLIANSSKT